MNTLRFILGVSIALAITVNISAQGSGSSSSGQTPEDPQVAAAKAKYEFDSWPQGPRRPGLDLAALVLPGYEGGDLSLRADGALTRRFDGSDGRSGVLVELVVADQVKQAHQKLAESVAFVSSTRTLPTARSLGTPVGDRAYVGQSGAGEGHISWIASVSGNLFVRVNCLDPRAGPHPDVAALTQVVVDAASRNAPLLEGQNPPRSAIERLSADDRSLRAGGSAILDFAVRDPAGGQPVLDWKVGGTAQGYVEEDDEGRLRVYATRSGRLELTLTAAGRYGSLIRQNLVLQVAPR